MFNRIKRAYYTWRLRLIRDELIVAARDVFECEVLEEAPALADAIRWHSRLKNEERYYEFQLARVPQPT